MEKFSVPIQIRWSDIDQNRHLRHSAYYDYGAMVRVACFSQQGLTTGKLEELNIGPVLFREEAVFRREIKFEDNISVDLQMLKATANFSRWSIVHHFYKADQTLAAVITIDATWIDLSLRKLTAPNAFIQEIFSSFPKAEKFEWVDPLKK